MGRGIGGGGGGGGGGGCGVGGGGGECIARGVQGMLTFALGAGRYAVAASSILHGVGLGTFIFALLTAPRDMSVIFVGNGVK
jgi:hypothetical protein